MFGCRRGVRPGSQRIPTGPSRPNPFHVPPAIREQNGYFQNRSLKISAALLLALLICFAALCRPAGAGTGEVGRILAHRLNVRERPRVDAAAVTTLKEGDQVNILRHLDGWLEIELTQGVGYIRDRDRYVTIIRRPAATGAVQGDVRGEVTQVEQEAERIYQEIAQSQAALKSVTEKEKEVLDRLNDLDLALNRSRRAVSASEKELETLKARIAEIDRLSVGLKERIGRLEKIAARRLVAYYKLNWIGKLNILASSESMVDLMQRRAAMEKILAYDESIWRALSSERSALQKAMARLHLETSKRETVEQNLRQQIEEMTGERRARERLLTDIREKKSLELAAIASLKDAAKDLDRILRSFRKEAVGPPPGKSPTAKKFIDLKGLLKLPVEGKIVARFGSYKNPRFHVLNFRSGIDIQAERGEPIRAVSGGRVLYASWFKGFGNMIIIDHGENYYTVYAHAEELFKEKGDPVETGEVIATVGDTGSMIGPSLYFEVRHHGKPLDPADWIDRG